MRVSTLPALLFVLLAVGCQNGEPSSPVGTPPDASAGQSPGAKEGEKGESNVVTATNSDRGVPDVAPEDNPRRQHQLRTLETATITVNGHAVPVWLMNDPEKRQEGMMHLVQKDVKLTEGMLFVFPEEQAADRGFWMSNTHLPLDIIYISKAGKVVSAVEGIPFDETNLPSGAPFQYVLEMRRGGAERLKVKVGSPVDIPSSARKAAN
ncbi:MAG: DUF192 domain-containing protein [Fimbriimonas sp.]